MPTSKLGRVTMVMASTLSDRPSQIWAGILCPTPLISKLMPKDAISTLNKKRSVSLYVPLSMRVTGPIAGPIAGFRGRECNGHSAPFILMGGAGNLPAIGGEMLFYPGGFTGQNAA